MPRIFPRPGNRQFKLDDVIARNQDFHLSRVPRSYRGIRKIHISFRCETGVEQSPETIGHILVVA